VGAVEKRSCASQQFGRESSASQGDGAGTIRRPIQTTGMAISVLGLRLGALSTVRSNSVLDFHLQEPFERIDSPK
jgi:hypothetical protein